MILRLALSLVWLNRNLDVRGSCYIWSKTSRNAAKVLQAWRLCSIIYLFVFLMFVSLEGFL